VADNVQILMVSSLSHGPFIADREGVSWPRLRTLRTILWRQSSSQS